MESSKSAKLVMDFKMAAKESKEKIKKDVQEKAINELKNSDVIPDDVLGSFLKLVNKSRDRYTISSRKKDVEALYKQVSCNETIPKDLANLAERLLYVSPHPAQLDIAATMINLLELTRHDLLMTNIIELLQSKSFRILAVDSRIKDVYPMIDSILTPDIYARKIQKDDDGNITDADVDYIFEIKVRNPNTDLGHFYNRYKTVFTSTNDYIRSEVGPQKIDVGVFNYTTLGFFEFGDTKLSELIDINPDSFDDVRYLIELGVELRSKYQQFPEYVHYISYENESDDSKMAQSGYKDIALNHHSVSEIKNLFGRYWDDLVHNMDNFSIMVNPHETEDRLIHAKEDLYEKCSFESWKFQSHYQSYEVNGSYGLTLLKDNNLELNLDRKNSDLYTITNQYSPSIYLPIAKTIMLNKYDGNRLLFYRDCFKGIKITGDRYSSSAYRLLDSIFNTVAIEIIAQKDTDIDLNKYHDVLDQQFVKSISDDQSKYRKVALVSGVTSDVTILANNSFSINHLMDKNMSDNINGYESKHYSLNEKKKTCLSVINSIDDIAKLDKHLSSVFKSKFHHGVFNNDLVKLDDDNMKNKIPGLPSDMQTKYMEHLYQMHSVFKSLISLNTINSHKYRLIQAQDPCTVIIMLPNADSLKGKPLRYFTATILHKDDTDSVEVNRLLGLSHSETTTDNYRIMLSKVISLDVTRLKLLNHAFTKYTLLISYYKTLKTDLNYRIHTLSWLLSQFVTISSLTVTDSYKNIMMAIYSDYSNINELIEDKLSPRPKTLSQVYILKLMFNGIRSAADQLSIINSNKNETEIDELGDVTGTGFSKNMKLKLPISSISVSNPREIIHESFILFYLGNKGLHGSPQELLNLYSTPYKFEEEYNEMINRYGTVIQELGNESNMSFSYDSMRLSSLVAYAELYSQKDNIRSSIMKETSMDKPILSIKQFSSTKSMVSNKIEEPIAKDIKIPTNSDIEYLERFLDSVKIDNPRNFIIQLNGEINRINRLRSSQSIIKMTKDLTPLPHVYIELKKGLNILRMEKYNYSRILDGDHIKQSNAKVFDEFYRLSEEHKIENLSDAYKNLVHDGDLMIRIFNKDQRTADDREIYTGNAQTRLCLFPVEMTYKAICKHIPTEAITISGDQKQKKLIEQRYSMLKKMKFLKKEGNRVELYSVSSDASKWSARDVYLKFFVTLAFNPYLHPDEKWFLMSLMIRYYDKKILLTDKVMNDLLRLANDNNTGYYEKMTNDYKTNWFKVRSNWLQGNLNMLSSFVHHCSTIYTETLLNVVCKNFNITCDMSSMVHSDDSTYDFLINWGKDKRSMSKQQKKNPNMLLKKDVGRFIISLLTYSNRLHCITLNEKKTYISTFYKEFLSTTIVGNELFFFYMSDLLPISSDTSYTNPLNDLASYSGYINNAFSHACPLNIIKVALVLINHLTLATYNMQYTSDKCPVSSFNCIDLPTQIFPRYKLDTKLAGVLPYYSADAVNILNDMIMRLDMNYKLKSGLIEDLVNIESLEMYLDSIKDNELRINYLKACLLCMDFSQYERDDEDPYNIVDYDLSQKSVIKTISLNRGTRLKKTYTYKKYLENENDVKLKSAINPIWCVSKPKDMENMKIKILANYMDSSFRDSLIFSTSAIDYGRRVISSNRSIYNIKPHIVEKEKPKNIKQVYEELNKRIEETNISAKDLQRYLSIYLFSDKKISMSLQVYYSKQETLIIDYPTYNKVIMPRSVYSEEFGKHSNTTLFTELLTNRTCSIDTIDPKSEKFISICEYVLLRLNNIKIYEYEDDIDDDYIEYYNYKYPQATSVDIDVDVLDLDDYGYRIYKNKITFMSLLVKYFIDIKKTINDRNYNIPNYPSPSSIIMTIDSLMKKDEISTKVYLSSVRTNRYDEYLLNRFGMYAHPGCHVKYKLGYKIKIVSDAALRENVKKYKTTQEPLSFLTKLMSKDRELFEDLIDDPEFTIGEYKFDELVKELQSSPTTNNYAFLYACNRNLVGHERLQSALFNDTRVLNYWIKKHGDQIEDLDASIALYMCRGNILKVETIGQNDAVVFTMHYYKSFRTDYGALGEILKVVGRDYSSQLRRAIIYRDTPTNLKKFYINRYGRYSPYKQLDSNLVCQIRESNILKTNIDYYNDENDDTRMIIEFEVNFGYKLDFLYKLRNYVDDEYYLGVLIDNLDITPQQIVNHLCSGELLLKYPEYFTLVSDRLGPGNIISLFSKGKGFTSYTSNIEPSDFYRLSYVGNYFQNSTEFSNSLMAKLCKCLDIICVTKGYPRDTVVEPNNVVRSAQTYKFDSDYYTFLDPYVAREADPYPKLFNFIAKVNGDPLKKVILMILTIFRKYPSRFINLESEIEI